jgi:hypothetical protein
MNMTLTLRRNTDRTLPVSHTFDLLFELPPDFQPGSVIEVPEIRMAQAHNAPGAPLAGLAVKVTTSFFLIGLSEAPADRDRNVELLKRRLWLEIPIVFANWGATLVLEKGSSGADVFTRAFAEWEK